MDRSVFKHLLQDDSIKLSAQSRRVLIIDSIFRNKNLSGKETSNKILLIVINELQELRRELTKILLGEEGSTIGVLEEFADVFICMNYLQYLFEITNEDLEKAMDIKLLEMLSDEEKREYLNLTKSKK